MIRVWAAFVCETYLRFNRLDEACPSKDGDSAPTAQRLLSEIEVATGSSYLEAGRKDRVQKVGRLTKSRLSDRAGANSSLHIDIHFDLRRSNDGWLVWHRLLHACHPDPAFPLWHRSLSTG